MTSPPTSAPRSCPPPSTSSSKTRALLASLRLAAERLLPFCKQTYPRYLYADHLQTIAAALERVERTVTNRLRDGEVPCRRLIVTIPPRHGKSETTSIRFPAWFLGRNPDMRIAVASYSANLAKRFSKQTRACIAGKAFQRVFPGIGLDPRSRAADAWDIDGRRGGLLAVGVGGSLTGHGANILLIDDPHKNRKEAESQVMRDSVWDWYTSTAYTRLEDDGAVIVVMTRWHEDDLVGRLLAAQQQIPGADQWEVIHLQAIDEATESKPLWPAKFPLKVILNIMRNVGARDWWALYMGMPLPAGGGILKREWFTVVRPEHLPKDRHGNILLFKKVIGCDLAISTKTTADFTVAFPMAQDEAGNFYLFRPFRAQMEWPDSRAQIISLVQSFKPQRTGLESVQFQASAAQELKREKDVAGFPFVEVSADKDKVTRAYGWSPIAQQKRIFLVEDGTLEEGNMWTPVFLSECAAFPLGIKDDQVDAVGIAFEMVRQLGEVQIVAEGRTY